MNTINSLLCATGITVVCSIILIIDRGMPTLEQAITGGVTMFVVAFVMLRFVAGSNNAKKDDKK